MLGCPDLTSIIIVNELIEVVPNQVFFKNAHKIVRELMEEMGERMKLAFKRTVR